VDPQAHVLIFDAAKQPFDEHVVPLLASTPVKTAPVNCEPWSVLKVSRPVIKTLAPHNFLAKFLRAFRAFIAAGDCFGFSGHIALRC
jgi:hypothetical protein